MQRKVVAVFLSCRFSSVAYANTLRQLATKKTGKSESRGTVRQTAKKESKRDSYILKQATSQKKPQPVRQPLSIRMPRSLEILMLSLKRR